MNSGWAYLYPIIFSCLVFGLAFAINRPPKYPVEIHHNVKVFEQVSKDTWMVSSDEPDTQRLPYSRWKCCPDFDCSPYIRPGFIAYELKYEPRNGCNSIRASGLGWFWQPPGSKFWTNLDGEVVK